MAGLKHFWSKVTPSIGAWLVPLFFTSSCMQGVGFFKQNKHGLAVEDAAVVSDQGGVLTASIKAGVDKTQVVNASGSSSISGASAAFPPGSLAISTEVTIQEGASLAAQLTSSDTGLSTAAQVQAAGAAIVVQAAAKTDAVSPFTLALPITTTGLNGATIDGRNIVVIYKVIRYDAGGQIYSGVVDPNDIEVQDGKVLVTTRYFGSYQVAYVATPVTAPTSVLSSVQSITTATQVASTSPTPSSSPTSNSLQFKALKVATDPNGTPYLIVSFNDSVDPSSISPSTLSVTDPSGTAIVVTPTQSATDLALRANPPLALDATYSLTLTSGLRGQKTAYLGNPSTQQFQTALGAMEGPRNIGITLNTVNQVTIAPQGPGRFDILTDSGSPNSLDRLDFNSGSWSISNIISNYSNVAPARLAGAFDPNGTFDQSVVTGYNPTVSDSVNIGQAGTVVSRSNPANQSWIVPQSTGALFVNDETSSGLETITAFTFNGTSAGTVNSFSWTGANLAAFSWVPGTFGIAVLASNGSNGSGAFSTLNMNDATWTMSQQFVSVGSTDSITRAGVAANANGSDLIVWADVNSANATSTATIYARPVVNGILQTTMTAASNVGSAVDDLHILSNGNGFYMALWVAEQSGNSSTHYIMASSFNGSTWTAPVQLATTGSTTSAIKAAMDPRGDVHVAWVDGSLLYWDFYRASTTTWSGAQNLGNDGNVITSVFDLKTMPGGYALLFYGESVSSVTEARYFSFEAPM